jgi:hypothetical protein
MPSAIQRVRTASCPSAVDLRSAVNLMNPEKWLAQRPSRHQVGAGGRSGRVSVAGHSGTLYFRMARPQSMTTKMGDAKPFLTRIVLENYKSIAASGVDFRPLTFLVGPNGSGKSNFLDALRFTRDSLRGSLDNALRDRGGIAEVRRRSGGHPTHFGVRLEFRLTSSVGHYAF